MKKRYFLLGAAALLAAASVLGASLAATSAVGGAATSELAAPTLQVSVGQNAAAELSLDTDGDAVMPGDTLEGTKFIIANSAETAFYVRVTVTKYWTDESSAKNNTTMDAGLIEMTGDDRWLQAESVLEGTSGETQVYYYAAPLQPGQNVPLDLLITLGVNIDNTYRNAGIVLNVTADAVQYVAGQEQLNENAILAAFGVEAAIGDDGVITSLVQ